MKSDRFTQMAGCELADIVAAHYTSPKSINPAEELEQLLADLKKQDSVRNLAVGLETLPIDAGSYGIVRDFCTWEEDKRSKCLELLSRQPAENRIPLLATMKSSGDSRDVSFLRKLADVQDKIVKLQKYGNRMDRESIASAIE